MPWRKRLPTAIPWRDRMEKECSDKFQGHSPDYPFKIWVSFLDPHRLHFLDFYYVSVFILFYYVLLHICLSEAPHLEQWCWTVFSSISHKKSPLYCFCPQWNLRIDYSNLFFPPPILHHSTWDYSNFDLILMLLSKEHTSLGWLVIFLTLASQLISCGSRTGNSRCPPCLYRTLHIVTVLTSHVISSLFMSTFSGDNLVWTTWTSKLGLSPKAK